MLAPATSSRSRAGLQRLLLGVVLVWLGIAGGAFWLHRNAPVTDVIMTPLPGWQVQVWYGTRTMISHSANGQGSATVPLVVVFFETPYTGIRRLARVTLPVWPLAVSTGALGMLGLLVMLRPVLARRHR